MKTIYALLALSMLPSAWASNEGPVAASIRSYRIQACDYWVYNFGSQGTPGYLCSSMPGSISVPDAYSVNDQIELLVRKIEELEKRLAALEKP